MWDVPLQSISHLSHITKILIDRLNSSLSSLKTINNSVMHGIIENVGKTNLVAKTVIGVNELVDNVNQDITDGHQQISKQRIFVKEVISKCD